MKSIKPACKNHLPARGAGFLTVTLREVAGSMGFVPSRRCGFCDCAALAQNDGIMVLYLAGMTGEGNNLAAKEGFMRLP